MWKVWLHNWLCGSSLQTNYTKIHIKCINDHLHMSVSLIQLVLLSLKDKMHFWKVWESLCFQIEFFLDDNMPIEMTRNYLKYVVLALSSYRTTTQTPVWTSPHKLILYLLGKEKDFGTYSQARHPRVHNFNCRLLHSIHTKSNLLSKILCHSTFIFCMFCTFRYM